jgi:hypothetical protein
MAGMPPMAIRFAKRALTWPTKAVWLPDWPLNRPSQYFAAVPKIRPKPSIPFLKNANRNSRENNVKLKSDSSIFSGTAVAF